jgi:hypothetical protein
MNWNTWREEVESITMHQLGMELWEIPALDRKGMKKAWQDGLTPDQYFADSIATHQEKEEIDLRLEL